MKTVAVIQARMGSTRLPGKMLLRVAGKPLIWHLIYRLRKCVSLDGIVLATTLNAEDLPLATFGEEAGIQVVRGSDEDVLGRFALAAEVSSADIIVRVNGDAPLIDPGFVDAQVRALAQQDVDFVTLADGVPCIHDGVDAMSRRALDFMMAEARQDPVATEHVTGYIKLYPEQFCLGSFEIPDVFQWDGARLSIDTPADLAFMNRLHDVLGVAAGEAKLDAVSRLLQSRPDLLALNAHVRQKDMTASHGTVLIRTDGGGALGFGHVMRTLAVAEVLRDEMGYGVVFAMDERGRLADGAVFIEAQGFRVEPLSGEPEAVWLTGLCETEKPACLLLDIRTELSKDDVSALGNFVEKIVTLDDGSERRLAADVAIFPPVPQVEDLDWTGSRARVIADWDHVVLSSAASKCGGLASSSGESTKMLVNFGGSDPFGLSLPAAQLVSRLTVQHGAGKLGDLEVCFVLGPGVVDAERLRSDILQTLPGCQVEIAPDDFAALAASQDVALVAFGVTAWELARAGVPMVLICLDEDQFASAAAFEAEGIAVRFLMAEEGALPDISDALVEWLANPDKRQKAAVKARSLIDGYGARRVAAHVV